MHLHIANINSMDFKLQNSYILSSPNASVIFFYAPIFYFVFISIYILHIFNLFCGFLRSYVKVVNTIIIMKCNNSLSTFTNFNLSTIYISTFLLTFSAVNVHFDLRFYDSHKACSLYVNRILLHGDNCPFFFGNN